jgi:hypothetical protein
MGRHLLDWQLPLACITVIVLSSLYYTPHHNHSTSQLLQDLASMQITGVLLASAAISAFKAATMFPPTAARRRQQMPLV